jgi:hypothetical protein
VYSLSLGPLPEHIFPYELKAHSAPLGDKVMENINHTTYPQAQKHLVLTLFNICPSHQGGRKKEEERRKSKQKNFIHRRRSWNRTNLSTS